MKSTLILLLPILSTGITGAATIANWKELNPNAAVVPITGADTDGPTFGDGTANSAQQAWIAGQFGTTSSPAQVEIAVGQTLTISGNLVLTGGTNNSNQFRFGIFNDGGQFALDDGSGWTGGWLHSIGTTTASDLFRARTDGPFISTGGNALDLNATITRTGAFDGDSITPFTFTVAVTRDSATTIDVVSQITGGDGTLSEQYIENGITTDVFTYSAVGLLFGGTSGVDRAQFSSVQYDVIPEPSLPLLGLLGITAVACSRRRRAGA